MTPSTPCCKICIGYCIDQGCACHTAHQGEEIAGVTATGETVTPNQALKKMREIVEGLNKPPQPEAGWEERFDDLTDETHYCHDLTPNDCKNSGHLKVKYRPLKSFISQELSRARKEELENYTNWLCETGYTDSDVYAEEPTAVERYLASLTKKE